MRIVHLAYSRNPQFNHPEAWLKRVDFFLGIPEVMAQSEEVVVFHFISFTGTIKRNGVTHYFKPMSKFEKIFPFTLHQIIKRERPDVIFIHGLLYPFQILLLRSAVGDKVQIFVQHHAEKPLSGIRRYLQQIADRFVSHYFFTSRHLASDWVTRKMIASQQKITEVMEASSIFYRLDKNIAREKTAVESAKTYIWVGRMDANKNPVLVIEAFTKFSASNPGCYLYMVSDGGELNEGVEQMVRQTHQIKLIGQVAHVEMLYWYNSVDFIISSSYYEGSGIAVCEAMSCGCIPILTDIPSFQMMTGNASVGILYQKGNADDLYLALQRSLELDLAIEHQKTLDQFKEKLSFDAIASTMLHVIKVGNAKAS